MTPREQAARGLLAIRHRAGLLAGLERIRPEWLDDVPELAEALEMVAPVDPLFGITTDTVRGRAAVTAVATHVEQARRNGQPDAPLPTELAGAAERALTGEITGMVTVEPDQLASEAQGLADELSGAALVRELMARHGFEPPRSEDALVVTVDTEPSAPLPEAPCLARMVPCRGVLATWIKAEYDVAHGFAPDELTRMTDPSMWPRVNPFFRSIEWLAGGPGSADPGSPPNWSGTVLETVGLPGMPIRTALDVRCEATEHHVVLTYRLAIDPKLRSAGDGDIDVDSGYVAFRCPSRTRRELGVAGPVWQMSSLKYVHFSRSPNESASFACQLGWADVMAQMALDAAAFTRDS